MKSFFEVLIYEVVELVGVKSEWDANNAAKLVAQALLINLVPIKSLKKVIDSTRNQHLRRRLEKLMVEY